LQHHHLAPAVQAQRHSEEPAHRRVHAVIDAQPGDRQPRP
jgi:hypothetical protein